MMMLAFKEIGIDPVQLNGLTAAMAHSCVINTTCNYLMHEYYDGLQEEDCLFNVPNWIVDFTQHIVEGWWTDPQYKPFH